MTVEELLAMWPKDRKLTINHMWLPMYKYVKNADGYWEYKYKDGDRWFTSVYSNVDSDLDDDDPNLDPNKPVLDEEYSFSGTVDEFDREEFEWLLEEPVEEVGDGIYEVRRYG